MFSLSFALGLVHAAAPPVAAPQLEDLLAASVLVETDTATGSGVAFHNNEHSFVWTAAHVIEANKTVKTVIDRRTGQPVVRVSFNDANLHQAIFEDGRKVGDTSRLAKVIRYSDRHDIALLKVHVRKWPSGSVSFVSSSDTPRPGAALWHVGSMQGHRGFNSVSDGVFSAAGRLRRAFTTTDTDDPLVYDQVALNAAHPGSSGGGVFRKSDGQCIGLVTEFLGPGITPGALCIIPARRLRAFAAEAKCVWALDATVAVPELDTEPAMQDDILLPSEPGK